MQSAEDGHRFPGTGRALGSNQSQMVSVDNSDSNLQARLLDNGNLDRPSDLAATGARRQSDGRY